jgi:hypothetical protein
MRREPLLFVVGRSSSGSMGVEGKAIDVIVMFVTSNLSNVVLLASVHGLWLLVTVQGRVDYVVGVCLLFAPGDG